MICCILLVNEHHLRFVFGNSCGCDFSKLFQAHRMKRYAVEFTIHVTKPSWILTTHTWRRTTRCIAGSLTKSWTRTHARMWPPTGIVKNIQSHGDSAKNTSELAYLMIDAFMIIYNVAVYWFWCKIWPFTDLQSCLLWQRGTWVGATLYILYKI